MLKSTRTAVGILVALNLAAGATSLRFIRDPGFDVQGVAFLGLLFAQAGLLGILAALGRQHFLVRMLESAAGLTYLCVFGSIGLGLQSQIFCGLLATCTVVVGSVLGILRYRGLKLSTLSETDSVGTDGRLRFGIRHLLAWILATAVLLRIGQMLDHSRTLGILFSYGLSYATVAIASPWAALGRNRIVRRCVILLLAAAIIGGVGPVYQHPAVPLVVDKLVFFVAVCVLEAVILLLSLTLIRRCGFRLVQEPKPSPEKMIA